MATEKKEGSNSSSFEDEIKKLSVYADQKLDKVFKQMLAELFKDMPEDPIQVCDPPAHPARSSRKTHMSVSGRSS